MDAVLELGLLSGIIADLVSILFRLLVEQAQETFLTGPTGSYETLASWTRLWLPVAGGIVIGLVLHQSPENRRLVGVIHVMEQLQFHQGRFPLWNALLQFAGGALALVSGHSVGREGPGVHLGVAACNLPARRWDFLTTACGCWPPVAPRRPLPPPSIRHWPR